MFNKKLKKRVEDLTAIISENRDKQREDYWSIRRDLDKLVEALNMEKREIHRVGYVKKGAPEAGKGEG